MRDWRNYVSLLSVSLLLVGLAVVGSEGPAPGRPVHVPVFGAEGRPASGWEDTVGPCGGVELQVAGSGYSPPCFLFVGDNGGATTRGVTGDTITVSFRKTDEPNIFAMWADMAGSSLDESSDDVLRTVEGLVEYVNRNFQFYGRRIELVPYQGRGLLLDELQGAGHDAAANDALRVSGEIEAFADLTGLTQPYAEALARREVLNVGAPFMPREWFADWAPYVWSAFPNCSFSAEAAAELGVQMLGDPARFAGGELRNRPRTTGLVIPNNRVYSSCGDIGADVLADNGYPVASRQNYIMDPGSTSAQAATVVSTLQAAEVTSVVCACDPLMLSSVVSRADQQGYEPEWLILGTAFSDLDLVGQMVARSSGDQWRRAFGGSPLEPLPAPGSGEGYLAYKSVRDDEPSVLVDLLHAMVLHLAIGIQMAGPDLTPATYETGMFAYPGGTGAAGTWRFTPDNRTGVVDYRVILWSPDATSPFNGQPGSYLSLSPRYLVGDPPDLSWMLEQDLPP